MSNYKTPNVEEIKIVLDWVKSKLVKAEGSKHIKPVEFRELQEKRKKIEELFDLECEHWIKTHCE
jgi:hypothetical protein